MPTVADLGKLVKQKYPQYGEMEDAALGRLVKTKFPQYRNFDDMIGSSGDEEYVRRRGGAEALGGKPAQAAKPAPTAAALEEERRVAESPLGPEALERFRRQLPKEQQARLAKQGTGGYSTGLGPIVEGGTQALTGVTQLPSRPWKAGTNILQGAFEAASVAAPSLAKAAPKAFAAAIPESIAAHYLTERGLESAGVGEEPREFAAEIAASVPWLAAARHFPAPKKRTRRKRAPAAAAAQPAAAPAAVTEAQPAAPAAAAEPMPQPRGRRKTPPTPLEAQELAGLPAQSVTLEPTSPLAAKRTTRRLPAVEPVEAATEPAQQAQPTDDDIRAVINAVDAIRARKTRPTIEKLARALPDRPVEQIVHAGEQQGKWHVKDNTLYLGSKKERGAITISSYPDPPQTPGEIAAREYIDKREAARQSEAQPIPFRQRFDEWLTRFKVGWSDQAAGFLDPIRKAEKSAGFIDAPLAAQRREDPTHAGSKVLPSERMSMLVDRTLRADNLARQFLIDNGFDKVYQALDNPDYFGQYLIARHAEALRRNNITTGRDPAKDALIISEFANRKISTGETYQELADKWVRDFTNKQLSYAVESGLISEELAAHLRTIYPDYIPFNRVFSELQQDPFTQPRGLASLSRQTVIKKLHGSKREIEDPFVSLAQKTVDLFTQGTRNEAARTLAGYIDALNLPKYSPQHKTPDNTFHYYDNGKKHEVVTDPVIARAARSLDVQDIDLLSRISGLFIRALKVGTTGPLAPAFILQNVAADVATTLTTARSTLPKRFLSSLYHALRKSPQYSEMVRGGGGFTSFDPFRADAKIVLEQIRAGASPVKQLGYVVTHPLRAASQSWRLLEDISSLSEVAGRLRLYENRKEQALRHGFSLEDAKMLAAHEANNALPNYLRQGSYARVLNNISAYFTAGIAGVRSNLQAAARSPERVALATTALMLPQALATLWNMGVISSGDPDADKRRAEAYQDIKKYEKEGYLIVLDPDPTTDEAHRYSGIKLRLQSGWVKSFLNMARVPLEAAVSASPMDWKAMVDAAFGTVSPIEPNVNSILSVGFPQTVKPAAQALANYDFFREQPKVPRHLEAAPPAMQAMPYTSGTAKKIGEAWDVSPILIDEFVGDTFGSGGKLALGVIDRALAAAGVIPKENIKAPTAAEQVEQRFFKVRGGAKQEQQFKALNEIKSKLAGEKTIIDRVATDLYAEVMKLPEEERAQAWDDALSATALKLNMDLDEVIDVADAVARREQLKLRTMPIERALRHSPARAVAAYVLQDIQSQPEEKRAERFEEWNEKTIDGAPVITDTVYDHLLQLMNHPQ